MLPALLRREPLAGVEEMRLFPTFLVPQASLSSDQHTRLTLSRHSSAALRGDLMKRVVNQVTYDRRKFPSSRDKSHEVSPFSTFKWWHKAENKYVNLEHIFIVIEPSAV